MNISPKITALVQAAGLVVYVIAISFLIQNVPEWIPITRVSPLVGMSLSILVFVISALVCGSLLLGYPSLLFFEGKKRWAIEVILWSVFWLVIFLFIVFLIVRWY